jgi:hypothetical protein
MVRRKRRRRGKAKRGEARVEEEKMRGRWWKGTRRRRGG